MVNINIVQNNNGSMMNASQPQLQDATSFLNRTFQKANQNNKSTDSAVSGGIVQHNNKQLNGNGPSNGSIQSSLSKSRQRAKDKFGSTVPLSCLLL